VDADIPAAVVRESWLAANGGLLPGDTLTKVAHSTHISGLIAREW
jgi:hypothetical protein